MIVIAGALWFFLSEGILLYRLGAALGLAILAHLALDLVMFDGALVLMPFIHYQRFQLHFWSMHPMGAFLLGLGYGIFCWWVYRGSAALLITIVIFNVAKISVLFQSIPGPEAWVAHRPTLLATFALIEIIVTLAFVTVTAKPARHSPAWA